MKQNTYSTIIKKYSQTERGREDFFLLCNQLILECKTSNEEKLNNNRKILSYLNSSLIEIMQENKEAIKEASELQKYYKQMQQMIIQACQKEEDLCQIQQ